MQTQHGKQHNGRRGFTLLVAVLVVSIVLAIGLSILTITLKEYILSNVARESAIALNAADAGMECALYWDRASQGGKFDVGASAQSIVCMGKTIAAGGASSGTAQALNETGLVGITWGTSQQVCAKVSVTKYFDANNPVPMGVNPAGMAISCPAGVQCTRTVSLGYNKACANIATPRTVERGLRTLY